MLFVPRQFLQIVLTSVIFSLSAFNISFFSFQKTLTANDPFIIPFRLLSEAVFNIPFCDIAHFRVR